MVKPKTSSTKFLTSPIETVDIAKMFRLPSQWLTAFSAALWAIIAAVGLFTPSAYGHWPVVYSIVAFLVAWWLYKMRKEAAIIALVISLVELLSGGGTLDVIIVLAALLVAVAAVRGTFAYSLLVQKPEVAEGV